MVRIHNPNVKLMIVVFILLGWLYAGFLVIVHFPAYLGFSRSVYTYNLLEFLVMVKNGEFEISNIHKGVAIVYFIISIVVFILIFLLGSTNNNSVGKKISTTKEIDFVLEKKVKKQSKVLSKTPVIGLRLAKTLNNEWIYCGWEGSMVDIWGPRTGKTTTRAVPLIFDAPGAVIVTSNKRDIVDDTAGFRALKTGENVWIFDPQNVCGTKTHGVGMYYDPLSYVTDPAHAVALAKIMNTASKDDAKNTKNDYFEISGPQLLANLFSVAALSPKHTIIDCFDWINSFTNNTPVHIMGQYLEKANANEKAMWTQTYNSLKDFYSLPQQQAAGVFGTAKTALSWLINTDVYPWITKGDGRKKFVPEDFVSSNQSLYLMSYEGTGCATPLITAFTNAILEAAEKYAVNSGGRMPIPLVCVLDEAANVCKLETLPKLYSHYGSRGIIISTILQSWKQGCNVWGDNGMQQMWDASFFKTYGGAVADTNFHKMLSEMIGVEYVDTVSSSHSKGSYSRSVNYASQQRSIMDISALAQLERGKIIMLAQTKMIMAIPQPWYLLDEYKKPIIEGKKYYDKVQGNIDVKSYEFNKTKQKFDAMKICKQKINLTFSKEETSSLESNIDIESLHSAFAENINNPMSVKDFLKRN